MTRNLLLIMSDEHNPKALGAAGHPVVRTPNLDRLAARGTRFTSAYCTSPICVPSRAGFATGLYTHQTGHWDNGFPYEGDPPGWGHNLLAAGHECVSVGKLHYRNETDPTGFSRQIQPMHVYNGIGDILGMLRTDPPVRTQARKYIVEAGPGTSTYQDYDRATMRAACDWLRGKADAGSERGWLLFVSFASPHFPLIAPPEFYDLYPHDAIDLPIAFHERDRNHPGIAEYARLMNFTNPPFSEAETRRAIAAYFGLTTFMDSLVGEVLATLEEAGLAGTTNVIYTSDHGDNNGRNGLFGKSTMYEDSVGVPLIMTGPGIPAGRVIDVPVSHVDIHPTVLDLVGEGIAGDGLRRPGRSLLRSLSDPDWSWPVLAEYHATCSTGGISMIRKRQLKYVHYVAHPAQLFDLEQDPNELDNLAADPARRADLEELRGDLFAMLDPEAVDRRAKADQAARVARHGGRDALLAEGAIGFTPVPGIAAERG